MAKINLGEHEYSHTGKLYGPGVVEVPDNIYDDMLEAVERKAVQTGVNVDPKQLSSVDVTVLDDDELLNELKRRKAIKDAAKQAQDTTSDADKKAAADKAKADKDAADAAAKAAADAAKGTAQ